METTLTLQDDFEVELCINPHCKKYSQEFIKFIKVRQIALTFTLN